MKFEDEYGNNSTKAFELRCYYISTLDLETVRCKFPGAPKGYVGGGSAIPTGNIMCDEGVRSGS